MTSAKHLSLKLSIAAAALLGLAALPPAALAQHENDHPTGFPLDWSHSHVKYGTAGNLKDQQQFEKDPRYLRHQYEDRRKWEKLADDAASGRRHHHRRKGAGDPMTVDWAVSLGNGWVAQNMSPAKFSTTGSTTPACSDMVIYALNVAGSTTAGSYQANLIGISNLYGTGNGCTSSPQVVFAYADTAGAIATSPVMSYYDNGAQVAFVANDGGKATLHVVKYATVTGNGTSASAPVAMSGAVAGTGSQKTLAFPATTTADTNSSPYVDYVNDAAYVGADNGTLYKISPVFGGGTPAVIWSVSLASGTKLTGPILDSANGVVLVGSSNGDLYAVNASTHATIGTLAVGDGSTSGGIVDPPVIVEEASGQATYSFVTTGCSNATSGTGTSSALYEASDTSSALTSLASRPIGSGNTFFLFFNTPRCATNNLHAPALDDASYSTGATGYIYVCGTVTQTPGASATTEPPEIYSFGFPSGGGTISASGGTQAPSGLSAADECSPITYFTSNGPGTERLFGGVGQNGAGNVVASVPVIGGGIGVPTTVGTPSGLGGTSGVIVDNASASASLANIYFSGLSQGNLSSGNCTNFTVTGKEV